MNTMRSVLLLVCILLAVQNVVSTPTATEDEVEMDSSDGDKIEIRQLEIDPSGVVDGENEDVENVLAGLIDKLRWLKSKGESGSSASSSSTKSTKAPTMKSTKAPTLKSTKAPSSSIKSTKAPTLKSSKSSR